MPGGGAARPAVSRLLPFLPAGLLLLVPPAVTALPSAGSDRADLVLGGGLALALVLGASWPLLDVPLPRPVYALVILAAATAGLLATVGEWAGAELAAKTIAAVLLGAVLGRQVLAAWWLLLFAGVILAIDAWSVFLGPTRRLVEEAPEALGYFLLPLPALGGPAAAGGLGVSDLILLTFFAAGAARTGLRLRASFVAMGVSLVIALAVVSLTSRALPALPFLATAFVAVNADRLGPRRRSPRDGPRPS